MTATTSTLILVSGSTKTVKRLAEKGVAELGHLMTPNNRNGMAAILATGLPWAADNGAFSGFDAVKFRRFLKKIADKPRCLFVVCPDVVGDARATICRFDEWNIEVMATGQPVAFVLQDGQEDLELPDADAYFIGGSTKFKLSRAALDLVKHGKYMPHQLNGPPGNRWIHMGRVNSRRRLRIAVEMKCDSVDGSSLSMFGDKYIHAFCRWSRQLSEQAVLY